MRPRRFERVPCSPTTRRQATATATATALSCVLLATGACDRGDGSKRDEATRVDPSDAAKASGSAEKADPAAPQSIFGLREFPLPSGPGSFAPAVATTGELLYLAWYERLPDGAVALRFARHDGQAWSPADTLVASEGIGFDARLPPAIGVIDELTVYVVWPERSPAGATTYRVSRSRGAGKRWAEPAKLFETSEPGPAPPSLARDGAKSLRVSWVEGESLRSVSVPEQGDFAGALTRVTTHEQAVCRCCDLATAGSSGAGHLALTRGAAGDRLVLRTDAGQHEVARPGPEVTCGRRSTALASSGSTIAAAWSDTRDRHGACVAFASSPKHWPTCTGVGAADHHPTGDLVMLDDAAAVLTLAAVADGGTEQLLAHTVRRDGLVGAPHLVASTRSCPPDACGRRRSAKFGDDVVWLWVDPGAEGQSRVRASIAAAAQLR